MVAQFSAIGPIDLQPEFSKSQRKQPGPDKHKYLLLRQNITYIFAFNTHTRNITHQTSNYSYSELYFLSNHKAPPAIIKKPKTTTSDKLQKTLNK